MVKPVYPGADPTSGLADGGKVVLPSAFFFERPKESLDNTILPRSVGRDELLRKPIEPARLAKPSALKDETVVASDGRSWPQCRIVPKRLIQAVSRALSASLARLLVDSSYPMISRLKQSMTATR